MTKLDVIPSPRDKNVNSAIEMEEARKVPEDEIDLETEIMIEIEPLKMSQRVLEMLYEGSVPVAGGVDIDDIREEGFGWPLLLIYLASFGALFAYFMYTNTFNNVHSKFLSLTNGTDDNICKEVALTITARFPGDVNGYWGTEPEFLTNTSIFLIDFDGSSVTNGEYASTMTGFKNQLTALGTKSSKRNVAWTTVAWTTLTLGTGNIKLSSGADIGDIIGPYVTGYWASREGICVPKSGGTTGSFDVVAKQFILNVPADKEGGNICPNQKGDLLSQFDPFRVHNSSFSMSIDARSIQTVISLNFGILNIEQLIVVLPQYKEFINLYYQGKFYINPRFPSMEPIFCISKHHTVYNFTRSVIAGPEICFLVYGGQGPGGILFGYPMVDQFNPGDVENSAYTGYMTRCECPHNKYDEYCNSNGLTYTIIYSLQNYSTTFIWQNVMDIGVRMQKLLVDDPINGDKKMMATMSNLTMFSMMAGDNYTTYSNKPLISYSTNISGYFVQYEYGWAGGESLATLLRNSWDDICPSQQCGAAFFAPGSSQFNQLFSPLDSHSTSLGYLSNNTGRGSITNFTIQRIMCSDTLTQKIAMDRFVKKSPVLLIQPYFECHFSVGKSFGAAIGNSYSSTSLFCNIGITIMGFLVVYYVNRQRSIKLHGRRIKKLSGKKIKEFVTKEKTDRTLGCLNEAVDVLTAKVLELEAERDKGKDKEGLRSRRKHKKEKNVTSHDANNSDPIPSPSPSKTGESNETSTDACVVN